jgi:hypothetical protein
VAIPISKSVLSSLREDIDKGEQGITIDDTLGTTVAIASRENYCLTGKFFLPRVVEGTSMLFLVFLSFPIAENQIRSIVNKYHMWSYQ